MFTRIQANGFKSLLSVDQRLTPFCALVGPNASGKTSFLDCIGFLSELMRNRGDVLATVQNRAANFLDLTWKGKGHHIQLALEADVPQRISNMVDDENFKNNVCVRYEIDIGLDEQSVLGINSEALWLLPIAPAAPPVLADVFPNFQHAAEEIFLPSGGRKRRKSLLRKTEKGNDVYYAERSKKFDPVFKLGRQFSALASLPADAESFPVSLWFLNWLRQGVQYLVLNSQKIRFDWWLKHIQTALPDVVDITTFVQPEDRRCYLRIHCEDAAFLRMRSIVRNWFP